MHACPHRTNAAGVLAAHRAVPGLSDLDLAVKTVLDEFDTIQTCGMRTIAVLSDSNIPYVSTGEHDALSLLKSRKKVSTFIFTMEQSKDSDGGMAKVIACQTGAIWVPVPNAGAVGSKISIFGNYFSKSLGNSGSTRIYWTEAYTYSTGEVGVTVASPVFEKTSSGSILVGVAGVDTIFGYMEQLACRGLKDCSTARLNVFSALQQRSLAHCTNDDIPLSQCELQSIRYDAAGSAGLCTGQCTKFAASQSNAPCVAIMPRYLWKHQTKWGTKRISSESYKYPCCTRNCNAQEIQTCQSNCQNPCQTSCFETCVDTDEVECKVFCPENCRGKCLHSCPRAEGFCYRMRDGKPMFDEVDISGQVIGHLYSKDKSFIDRRCCTGSSGPGARCVPLENTDVNVPVAGPVNNDNSKRGKFVVIKGLNSFEEARRKCTETGAGLAEPKSVEARNEIQAVLAQSGVNFAFIGAQSRRCRYKTQVTVENYNAETNTFAKSTVTDYPCRANFSPGQEDVDWLSVWSRYPDDARVYDERGTGCKQPQKTFLSDMSRIYGGDPYDVERFEEARVG